MSDNAEQDPSSEQNQDTEQADNSAAPATDSSGTIPIPRDISQRTLFTSTSVKSLKSEDFNVDSPDLVSLKSTDCTLVLFYAENTESFDLLTIWSLAAQQVAGPVFAAVNLLVEEKITRAFFRLKSIESHPLAWAGIVQVPFILSYRGGFPIGFYNGSREVQTIIDYSLTLACTSGYYEKDQLFSSMGSENRIQMDHPAPYNPLVPGSPPIRTKSTDYLTTAPIRGLGSKSTLKFVPLNPPAVAAPTAPSDSGAGQETAPEDSGIPSAVAPSE